VGVLIHLYSQQIGSTPNQILTFRVFQQKCWTSSKPLSVARSTYLCRTVTIDVPQHQVKQYQ
jgi:hypothetical protein